MDGASASRLANELTETDLRRPPGEAVGQADPQPAGAAIDDAHAAPPPDDDP